MRPTATGNSAVDASVGTTWERPKQLTLVAPADGVIIAAPRTALSTTSGDRLPTWSGSLLEATTAGAYVEPGTLVCMIGDPQRLSAVLLVNDTDVKRLQPGQTAKLQIEQLPDGVTRRAAGKRRHRTESLEIAAVTGDARHAFSAARLHD